MKKTIIFLVAVCCVVSASAQNSERTKGVETKKGYNILPAAGDFAIGIDATPFLDYGVSLFNGGSAPTFGYNGSIYGKYFTRDNQAIRARLLVNVNSKLDRFKVKDDYATLANPLDIDATAYDTRSVNFSQFGLYGGYEWRRGYGRLQAFWGGEAGFDFTIKSTYYEWANPMTDVNQKPTSANWAGTGTHNPDSRDIKVKGQNMFGLQIGGFAGIEYFVARKISLGGQVGLDLRYSNNGQDKVTSEKFNSDKNQLEEKTVRGSGYGNREWVFKTPVSANIFMMFHF